MDRESAEARVRDMEDQLAEFQDEVRRETGNKTVTRRKKKKNWRTNTLAQKHRE